MNKFANFLGIHPRGTMNYTIIASLFLVFFSAWPVWGATYYVKNVGNDSLDGLSDATAWATIAKVRATVKSGDTVYFRSQDTWTSTSVPVLTATSGVIYNGSAYGSGTRATIKPLSGSGYGAVNIFASNVIFKGFNIDLNGLYLGGINIGMAANMDLENITVDDCLVHDSALSESTHHYYYGIFIGAYGVHTTTNVQILNTKVYRMGHEGISVYPSWMQSPSANRVNGVTIRGCEVYDVGSAGDSRGNAIDLGLDSDNVTVEYNYVHDFYEDGIAIVSGGSEYSGLGEPNNSIVRYNIIQNSPTTGSKVGLAIRTNDGGDGAIYGNIFSDANIYTGSDLRSGSWKIYNNTIYVNRNNVAGISIWESASNTGGIDIKNNIIYQAGTYYAFYDYAGKLKASQHTNNLYYKPSGGFLVWANNTEYKAANIATWEATAITTDPAFIGGTLPTGFTGTYGSNMIPNTDYFAISSGAALNNGATLGNPYTGCINGAGLANPILRPQGAGYDIGAYEFGPGTTRPLAPTGLTIQN